MKTWTSIFVCCLSLVSSAFAKVATVCVTSTNGSVQLTVGSKQVTREGMKDILRTFAKLDKDQLLYVIVDEKVPATALVEVISDIQSTGLHDLVLMSPADEGGKKGMYQITIDSTKRKFGGCIAGVDFDSGFHETQSFDEQKFEEAIKTLMEESSQPTNTPYSSPATGSKR